jgi:hypothetical protein
MKKTSRVSRRRKSISGSRRYKKGKTANKKRVKRVSSSTRRWISGGGGGDVDVLSSQALAPSSSSSPPASDAALPPSSSTSTTAAPNNQPVNPAFDAFKTLIITNLKNNAVTIESTKLNTALPVINSVIKFLKTQQIDVTKMEEIENKIVMGTPLSPADLLELITFLYTNRNILKSGQIQLKPLFESILELVINKLPINIKIIALTSKAALLAVL